MTTSLESILGRDNLTGVIQDERGGLTVRGLPDGILTANIVPVEGNTAKWVVADNARTMALVNAHGAASQAAKDLPGVSTRTATCISASEHMVHQANTLANLASFDSEVRQRKGSQVVMRQVREFRRRFENLRIAATISMLTAGKIVGKIGEPLSNPGGSEPTGGFTVDAGVPAGNQTQLDILGDGDIIAASWATATTDIAGHVGEIIDAIAILSGYSITNCIYGRNIPGYLGKNTTLANLVNATSAQAAVFQSNRIPSGFLDLDWWPGSGLFFLDPSGTRVRPVGDDEIIMFPDMSEGWWSNLEGSTVIPGSAAFQRGTGDSIPDMLNDLEEIQGMWSWAEVVLDPAGIKHVAGDCFLPAVNVPNALVIGDVTP